MERTIEEIKDDLIRRIERCDLIINGLEKHPSFLALMEDFEASKKRLDDSWHLIMDDKVWQESRTTKLALVGVLTALDSYRHDRLKALEEMKKLVNENNEINKDYDIQ